MRQLDDVEMREVRSRVPRPPPYSKARTRVAGRGGQEKMAEKVLSTPTENAKEGHLAADTVQHGAVKKGASKVRAVSAAVLFVVKNAFYGAGNGADSSTRSVCGTPG